MKRPPNHSISMIFLCAGASRRMGRSKALLPWKDTTILGHHWKLLEPLCEFDPWIVTQPDDPPLCSELDRLGWPERQRVVNPLAPAGEMIDSIRSGIRVCLREDYPSIGIALIDQPLIRTSTFRNLAEAIERSSNFIVQPACEGRRGHPVILPRVVAEQLLSSPAETLKTFLSGNESLRASVEVSDRGIWTDLDTPEQYDTHLPLTA